MTALDNTLRLQSPGRPMSEDEFLAWYRGKDFKAEWVDGEVTMRMSVNRSQDSLQWWLRNLLQFYVKRRTLGQVLGPQFPIRLAKARLEPDIIYISNARVPALHPTYLDGPADLAIEIVSPESESRDWRTKYQLYEAGGIKEYWIVDAMSQQVEAYTRDKSGTFALIPLQGEGADTKLPSVIVPGWWVKPQWLWNTDYTDVLEALRELGV